MKLINLTAATGKRRKMVLIVIAHMKQFDGDSISVADRIDRKCYKHSSFSKTLDMNFEAFVL